MALEPLEPVAEEEPNAELADMTRRFWVSVALTVPLLGLEMGGMAMPELVGRLSAAARLWIQLVLATPVALWGGWSFFVRGWQSVVMRSLNMFTLIADGRSARSGPDASAHGEAAVTSSARITASARPGARASGAERHVGGDPGTPRASAENGQAAAGRWRRGRCPTRGRAP
jgi:hypothetical protein